MSAQVRILQNQPFPQLATEIVQSNRDTQVAKYQDAFQQYQQTMQHVLGVHQTPQYNTSGFVNQPAPTFPSFSNPAPVHWHRPAAQSNATVTPPAEKTSQQPAAKPKSNTWAMTDERLATIQRTQSSILSYTPPATENLPTLSRAAKFTPMENTSLMDPIIGGNESIDRSSLTPELDMLKQPNFPQLSNVLQPPNTVFDFNKSYISSVSSESIVSSPRMGTPKVRHLPRPVCQNIGLLCGSS